KFRIPLVDNIVEEGIADALIRDVAHGLPAAYPSIIPKGNVLARQRTVFGVKGKTSHMLAIQTNVVLPGAKCRYPVIKGGNGHGHGSAPLGGISFSPMRYGSPTARKRGIRLST